MTLILDVGGSYIKYEIVEAGEVGRVETQKTSLEEFLDSFIHSFNISRVGIAIAGQIRNGYVVSSPNINIKHRNIVEYIKRRWSIEVFLENDLNVASLAEANYWGVDNLVALYSGRGLSAGVVDDKRVVKGAFAMAGEIGHIPYKETPFSCGCGKNNCLELYSSGGGLDRWIEYYNCSEKSLVELKSNDCNGIAKEYEKALIHASATMVTLFNPSILVLGGGVVEDNRYLIDLIREELPKYALKASVDNVRVEMTRLYDATLKGMKILLAQKDKSLEFWV